MVTPITPRRWAQVMRDARPEAERIETELNEQSRDWRYVVIGLAFALAWVSGFVIGGGL